MSTDEPPATHDLDVLRDHAAGCTRCHLYRDATQTVFGAGPPDADLMVVGEQPGDREDRDGSPFVGPAGHMLDDALRDAGIDRARTYVTNVVKHFKFRRQGKRRIHQKPNREEVVACLPWLESEMAAVAPAVVVLMGATAAQALLGSSFRVTRQRGQVFHHDGHTVTATVHPSSILRGPSERRHAAYADFVADLRGVVELLDAG